MFWILLVVSLSCLQCVKNQEARYSRPNGDGDGVPLAANVNLGDEIPGVAGVDYPIFSTVPRTSFSCNSVIYPGYYADTEAGCQAFHICERGGKGFGFLCPNGTLFSQAVLVCDWWFNVRCDESLKHYSENQRIFDEMNAANERLGIDKIALTDHRFISSFGDRLPTRPDPSTGSFQPFFNRVKQDQQGLFTPSRFPSRPGPNQSGIAQPNSKRPIQNQQGPFSSSSGSPAQGQMGFSQPISKRPGQGLSGQPQSSSRRPGQSPQGRPGQDQSAQFQPFSGRPGQSLQGRPGQDQSAQFQPFSGRPGQSSQGRPGQDQSAQFQPFSGRPGQSLQGRPGQDQAAQFQPFSGRPGQSPQGRPGQDQSGQFQPFSGRPGQSSQGRPGQDQPGPFQPFSDRPGQSPQGRPGQDQSRQFQPFSDRPGQSPQGRPGQDQSGQFQPFSDRPGQSPQGRPGQDQSGQFQPFSDRPGQSPQGRPGQGQPAQFQPFSGRPGQSSQGRPGQDQPAQFQPFSDRPGQSPQGRPGQDQSVPFQPFSGRPGQSPQGRPEQSPQGRPGQSPQGRPGQSPQGRPGQSPQGQGQGQGQKFSGSPERDQPGRYPLKPEQYPDAEEPPIPITPYGNPFTSTRLSTYEPPMSSYDPFTGTPEGGPSSAVFPDGGQEADLNAPSGGVRPTSSTGGLSNQYLEPYPTPLREQISSPQDEYVSPGVSKQDKPYTPISSQNGDPQFGERRPQTVPPPFMNQQNGISPNPQLEGPDRYFDGPFQYGQDLSTTEKPPQEGTTDGDFNGYQYKKPQTGFDQDGYHYDKPDRAYLPAL